MSKLVGESIMVTSDELAKEFAIQKERNRLLKEALEAMRNRLDEVAKTSNMVKEKLEVDEDKGKVVGEDDIVPKSHPPIKKNPSSKPSRHWVARHWKEYPCSLEKWIQN